MKKICHQANFTNYLRYLEKVKKDKTSLAIPFSPTLNTDFFKPEGSFKFGSINATQKRFFYHDPYEIQNSQATKLAKLTKLMLLALFGIFAYSCFKKFSAEQSQVEQELEEIRKNAQKEMEEARKYHKDVLESCTNSEKNVVKMLEGICLLNPEELKKVNMVLRYFVEKEHLDCPLGEVLQVYAALGDKDYPLLKMVRAAAEDNFSTLSLLLQQHWSISEEESDSLSKVFKQAINMRMAGEYLLSDTHSKKELVKALLCNVHTRNQLSLWIEFPNFLEDVQDIIKNKECEHLHEAVELVIVQDVLKYLVNLPSLEDADQLKAFLSKETVEQVKKRRESIAKWLNIFSEHREKKALNLKLFSQKESVAILENFFIKDVSSNIRKYHADFASYGFESDPTYYAVKMLIVTYQKEVLSKIVSFYYENPSQTPETFFKELVDFNNFIPQSQNDKGKYFSHEIKAMFYQDILKLIAKKDLVFFGKQMNDSAFADLLGLANIDCKVPLQDWENEIVKLAKKYHSFGADLISVKWSLAFGCSLGNKRMWTVNTDNNDDKIKQNDFQDLFSKIYDVETAMKAFHAMKKFITEDIDAGQREEKFLDILNGIPQKIRAEFIGRLLESYLPVLHRLNLDHIDSRSLRAVTSSVQDWTTLDGSVSILQLLPIYASKLPQEISTDLNRGIVREDFVNAILTTIHKDKASSNLLVNLVGFLTTNLNDQNFWPSFPEASAKLLDALLMKVSLEEMDYIIGKILSNDHIKSRMAVTFGYYANETTDGLSRLLLNSVSKDNSKDFLSEVDFWKSNNLNK